MFRIHSIGKSTASLLVIVSFLLSGIHTRANDIVPSDDLVGGASVFVFRNSRKRPQERGASASSFRAGGGSVRSARARINAQISANRKRNADAAKARAAAVARARARERNAKLRLSNTLTARAETQMESGDIAGATTNFREALKANPKNADATTGLGEALTATGIETAGENYNDAAIPFLEEAVKLNPKNEIAYAKLGEIHDAKDRNNLALANYERALALDPAMSSLYIPAGLLYVTTGDYIKAETYLGKAEAAGIDSPESRMARVEILSRQNRNDEALAALDRMIQAEPKSSAALYRRAVILDRMNQTEQAFAALQRTIQIDQNFGPAWFDLGVIYYNRGDYSNALNAYQRVSAIDPLNYQAQANLASTYRQLERYPEANAAYKAAEPGNTKNADHYSEWGFCLGKTNEWDKSVARLNTARELSPNAVDNTNLGWAYYNAARIDRDAGREAESRAKLELARAFLQKAVELDPKLDAAYMNLGSTNNSLGDHQAAVDALNQALVLRSDWVIAINQLGVGYRGLNNMTAAIAQFQRVTALDANNVFGLYSLGEVYHLTGNKKEAKRIHGILKRVNPAFATKLDKFFDGKAVVDDAKRKIEGQIPKVPRFPY